MFVISLLTTLSARADALSEYAARRLVCWSETRYQQTTEIYEDGTVYTEGGNYRVWGVKDGRGHALDTVTFANLIGDRDYIEDLQVRVARNRKTGGTLTLAGIPVAAAGGAMLLLGREQASFPLLYGGGMAFAGGLALGGYGLAVRSAAKTPLVDVTRAYEYGLAAQRCASHNQAIREELGLTPEDTHLLDTASVTWPDERVRHLVIRPVFAPNALGIAGTF